MSVYPLPTSKYARHPNKISMADVEFVPRPLVSELTQKAYEDLLESTTQRDAHDVVCDLVTSIHERILDRREMLNSAVSALVSTVNAVMANRIPMGPLVHVNTKDNNNPVLQDAEFVASLLGFNKWCLENDKADKAVTQHVLEILDHFRYPSYELLPNKVHDNISDEKFILLEQQLANFYKHIQFVASTIKTDPGQTKSAMDVTILIIENIVHNDICDELVRWIVHNEESITSDTLLTYNHDVVLPILTTLRIAQARSYDQVRDAFKTGIFTVFDECPNENFDVKQEHIFHAMMPIFAGMRGIPISYVSVLVRKLLENHWILSDREFIHELNTHYPRVVIRGSFGP